MILIRTSRDFGGATITSSITSGSPAFRAIAAAFHRTVGVHYLHNHLKFFLKFFWFRVIWVLEVEL
ncbi:hypothetical protein HanIR_Chr08g0352991 [Helianthus annuus]|nr:hypothetical protein HanIR_Chr08g0352991 [Helianthus annuus]